MKYPDPTLIFISALITTASAHAQTSAVLSPKALVDGKSQADWSRSWWQWAGSFEREDSPVGDATGSLCDRGQSGPVWFLAGTYGTHRTVRTCRIPRGKHLFFPLINYVVMPRSAASVSCSEVRDSASAMTDDASALVLDIDGVRVPDLASYRQATVQCFDMGARTKGRIKVFPAAANGYYVMLKPLSPGKHEINFGGALPGMLQAVTYTLQVE